MSPQNGLDTSLKIVEMEGDMKTLRSDITHVTEMTRQELHHVRNSVDKIEEAVTLLLKTSQETHILRREVQDTRQELSQLYERVEKRQESTDPIILEAQQFLASFRTGSMLVLKGLGILQLVLIAWLSFNETRLSEIEQDITALKLANVGKTTILKIPK